MATVTTNRIKVQGIRIVVDSETGEVLTATHWKKIAKFAQRNEHGFSVSDSLMAQKELDDDSDRPAIIWQE